MLQSEMPPHYYNKWIEIDVNAIENNLAEIRANMNDEVVLIAVLKADAYGHGAVAVAKILSDAGVDFFAVTFLDEARELRRAGIQGSILLLSPLIDEEQMEIAINENLIITLTSWQEGRMLDRVSTRMAREVGVHLKVETGLGRFGFSDEEILPFCRQFKDHAYIKMKGIYTHTAAAASDPRYTSKQYQSFMKVVDGLAREGVEIPLKHCANSAGFLKYPAMHMNAVRIGTLLSGQYPVGKFNNTLKLQDPFHFKARILSVKRMPAGSYLGYYKTYRLKKDALVAVIPVGFRDGLALEVSNPPAGFVDFLKVIVKKWLAYFNVSRFTTSIRIREQFYPVRGKVFMQLALVEIPAESAVAVGDIVEVPVRKTLAASDITRIMVRQEREQNEPGSC